MDTNTVLYLLGGRSKGPLAVETCFVSVITELELLSYQGITQQEEATIRRFLSRVSTIQLTEAIRAETIKVRRSYRLKLLDAIVAATALHLHTPLISNDLSFTRVQSLDVLRPQIQ